MLTPTDTEITSQAGNLAAGGTMPAAKQAQWLVVLRQYADAVGARLPDAASRLAAVTGYGAQQMLAALTKINALGQKLNTVTLDVTTRKKDDERLAWAEYGAFVLYDESEAGRVAVKLVRVRFNSQPASSEFSA